MKTITATLAFLLLAGASTAALAQDNDRGDRAQPQSHPQGAPQAAPHGGQPGGGGPNHGEPGRGGPPGGQPGGMPRSGPPNRPQGMESSRGQAFQGQAPAAVSPGPQHPDRGPGPGAGARDGRQFDHERGPREVIPPGADRGADRGPDRGFDGRGRQPGVQPGGRGNPWSAGQHWQPGRAPPVFWSQDRFRIGAYRAPYGYYVRSWGFGDFLPRGWYGQNYWIGDYLNYDLPYPPPGYEWVRVGGDALMIDRFSGRIVQVVRGIFW